MQALGLRSLRGAWGRLAAPAFPRGLRVGAPAARAPAVGRPPAAATSWCRGLPRWRSIRPRGAASAAAAAASPLPPPEGAPLPPTAKQLWVHAMRQSIPMIGFGIMDNLVMITAGQQIELSIGAWLGLSTLAAAGLGQICSDISGLTVGGTVDAFVARLKLPRSGLTNAQTQTLAVKVARTAGQCAGVTVGCLLGMTCLLFMDTEKIDREKRCAELNGLFNLVEKNSLETVETLIGADLAVLWIYDEGDGAQGPELLARVMTRDAEKNPDCTEILDLSMAKVRSVIAEQKTAVIRSKRGLAKNDAGLISNSIIVPVVTREGQAVGAVQLINKRGVWGVPGLGREMVVSFKPEDEGMVKVLCSHIAMFLSKVREADEAQA